MAQAVKCKWYNGGRNQELDVSIRMLSDTLSEKPGERKREHGKAGCKSCVLPGTEIGARG